MTMTLTKITGQPHLTITGKQGIRLVHAQFPNRQKADPNQLLELVFAVTDEEGENTEMTLKINAQELFCHTEEGQQWLKSQTGPQGMRRTG